MRGFLFAALLWLAACSPSSTEWHATDIQGVMPDLAFALRDGDGKAVDAGRFAGKINILFFGYTHCPDVCPMTLGKLTFALRSFDPALRQHFNVLFVSVDPARDTPPVLKKYCAAFGPRFHCLTGTLDQLKALTRRYRVTFGYGKKDANGDYAVSHSSAMYIFDPDGHVRLLAKGDESPQDMAEDLKRLWEMLGE